MPGGRAREDRKYFERTTIDVRFTSTRIVADSTQTSAHRPRMFQRISSRRLDFEHSPSWRVRLLPAQCRIYDICKQTVCDECRMLGRRRSPSWSSFGFAAGKSSTGPCRRRAGRGGSEAAKHSLATCLQFYALDSQIKVSFGSQSST